MALFVVEARRFGPRTSAVLEAIPQEQKVIAVVNKIDTVEARDADLIPFLERLGKTREFDGHRAGQRPDRQEHPRAAARRCAKRCPRAPAAYPADQLTDRDERFFAAELLREKLFEALGEELPYRCEVVIDSFKEEGKPAAHRGHDPGRARRARRRSSSAPAASASSAWRARRARTWSSSSAARSTSGPWVKVRKAWTDDARVAAATGLRVKKRAEHEAGYVLHTYPYKETSLIVEALHAALRARGAARARGAPAALGDARRAALVPAAAPVAGALRRSSAT